MDDVPHDLGAVEGIEPFAANVSVVVAPPGDFPDITAPPTTGPIVAPSASDSPGRKNKKKRDSNTLRKAPQAPKRFKSSYICFFMAKQPEIKEFLGDKATVTEISKRSAEMWKNLSSDERRHWDDAAAKDKERYMIEKASYTGPWQVPWKRAKKDPSAPKRPMSAFLYFSQGKRSVLKKENPGLKNTEISRLLGEKWRNASVEEKRPHVEREKKEREKYKVAIAEWRVEFEAKQEAQRKAHAEQLLANTTAFQAANAAGGAVMQPNVAAQPHPQQQQQQQQQADLHQPIPHNPHGVVMQQFADPNQYRQPPPPAAMSQGFMYPQAQMPGFPGYSYPPGPYSFPTNGRQPVILGPSGAPHYPVSQYNTGSPNDGSSQGGGEGLSPGGYDDVGDSPHFGATGADSEPQFDYDG